MLSKTNFPHFLNKHFVDVKIFDLDNCIKEYRNYLDVPDIQKDLKIYYESICHDIFELISKDYTDFIILSSNVSGLDKHVKIIISSLDKMKTCVEESKHCLDRTLNLINLMMENKTLANKKKQNVCHALFVLAKLQKIKELNILNAEKKHLSLSVLERNAHCCSFIEFYSSAISNIKLLNLEKENVEHTYEAVLKQLNAHFLNSISLNDSETLYRVLHIYLQFNREKYAENVFRESFVKNHMQQCITNKNVLDNGISKVHEDILNFIHVHCSLILFLTEKHTEIAEGYDFLVNAVWPEVVQQLKYLMVFDTCIAQDIKNFHKNYTATMLFLEKFEQKCNTQASIKRLHKHNSYKEFIQEWNIDIYFRMIFMEIATDFETVLSLEFEDPNVERKTNTLYILRSSLSLHKSIEQCWDDEVFLTPLTYNFWKLTLQLVSRYNKWAHYFLGLKQKEKTLIFKTAAAFISDVESLMKNFQDIFSNKIQARMQRNPSLDILKRAFDESIQMLNDISKFAKCIITESLTEQCNFYLTQATDIPKLFRKTNREIPSKPSEYAVSLVNFIEEFVAEISTTLSEEWKIYFLTYITNIIGKQWVNIIHETLTLFQKIEKSLKILKRAKTKISDGSDIEKIKHQLKLDVNYANNFFEKVNIENAENYSKIINTINSF